MMRRIAALAALCLAGLPAYGQDASSVPSGITRLTGPITTPAGVGSQATSIASQTGTGTTFVMQVSPRVTTCFGIDVTCVNQLDIAENINSSIFAQFFNSSALTSATVGWDLKNNANSTGQIILTGSNFTPANVLRSDALYITTSGAGGITISTTGATPIYFGINNVQTEEIDTSGRHLIGFTADQGGGEPLQINGGSFTKGAISTGGTIPVATGTGTPTIAAGSTNTAGEVTSGTTATSVIITFAGAPLAKAPFCTVTPQTNLVSFIYTISTSAISITQTATTGEKIDYICLNHA